MIKGCKPKPAFCIILIALITVLGITKSPSAAARDFPFKAGERLTFEVKWLFIPAGEVVFEVLPMENIGNVPFHHFVMTASTYSYIDPFYKLRNRIDAYTDENIKHSVLYINKQDGNTKREVVVKFDWEKQEAQYSNFGEKIDPIPVLPGSFDPLSIFYAFRLHDLKAKMVIEKPVTDGKKCVLGKARVIKREKITVSDTKYDTYLIEPDLEEIGGIFSKSQDAKFSLWVTADDKRFPVKVKSSLAVGSFIAELISHENILQVRQGEAPAMEKKPARSVTENPETPKRGFNGRVPPTPSGSGRSFF